MYGNLLSREIVVQLVKEKIISIDKFDSNEFGTAHYPVCAAQYIWNNNGKTSVHDFNLKNNDKIELEPKQYGVVKISSRITLPDGIVGQFTPSSALIECGLLLTAGKLDQGYEGDIVFGVYNANSVKAILTKNMKLAYISFYDLRGVSNSVGKYYEEYVREMAKQRALDDYLAKKFNCDFTHARSEF